MTMEGAVTKQRQQGRPGTSPTPAAVLRLPIWDPFVRAFHWLLVAGFVANFFELVRPGKTAHQIIGYVILGLIAARLVWGLVGPRHARFADFVRTPGQVIAHLRQLARHRDRRYLGHSPAGGAMIVALLLTIAALGATGWFSRTDWFFGVKWMEETHEILANALLALVILHVLGVVHASWRHRENLVLSMLTGRKRAINAHVPPTPEPLREHAPADRRG